MNQHIASSVEGDNDGDCNRCAIRSESAGDEVRSIGASAFRDAPLSSAARTALDCPNDRDLRVPCYCEENVWRLAYRRLHERSGVNEGGVEEEYADYYVVFISNQQRVCPMLCQLAKEDENDPCFWDYHVVLLRVSARRTSGKRKGENAVGIFSGGTNEIGRKSVIFDMDSRLPWGCSLEDYIEGSFRGLVFIHEAFRAKYAPLFRVIDAGLFLRHFYSDRMHMYDQASGRWHATPPTYECIMTGWEGMRNARLAPISSTHRSNLDDYVSMNKPMEKLYEISLDSLNVEERDNQLGEVLTLSQFLRKFGNNS